MSRLQHSVAGFVLLGLVLTVRATEGGGGAYRNGMEGLMAGDLPAPGQYIENYMLYYHADSFPGFLSSRVVGYRMSEQEQYRDILRFINVSSIQVFGGNWAQQVLVPVGRVETTFTPTRSALAPIHERDNGLGNIVVDPFILGWHSEPFHYASGIDIYLPTRQHDSFGQSAVVGRQCWTFEPYVAGTYLNEQGIELSAKFMYDFNTKNTDDNYLSGQEVHMDFAVAMHLHDWTIGMGGYWYQQTTPDEIFGHVDESTRGRALAFGPVVSYQHWNMRISLAWDREVLVDNRPEGDAVWFQLFVRL